MLVSLGGTPTWWLHTGLCKFEQNISSNINLKIRKQVDLTLGEVSKLFISYNIISLVYSLSGFQIIFLIVCGATQEYHIRLAEDGNSISQ